MTNMNMIFFSYRLFEDEQEVDISILQAPNCCPWLVSCQVLHSAHHPSQAPSWSWGWAWDGQLDPSLVLTCAVSRQRFTQSQSNEPSTA